MVKKSYENLKLNYFYKKNEFIITKIAKKNAFELELDFLQKNLVELFFFSIFNKLNSNGAKKNSEIFIGIIREWGEQIFYFKTIVLKFRQIFSNLVSKKRINAFEKAFFFFSLKFNFKRNFSRFFLKFFSNSGHFYKINKSKKNEFSIKIRKDSRSCFKILKLYKNLKIKTTTFFLNEKIKKLKKIRILEINNTIESNTFLNFFCIISNFWKHTVKKIKFKKLLPT